jgi:hypothetical protein
MSNYSPIAWIDELLLSINTFSHQLAKVLYSADETTGRRRGFKRRLKTSPNFQTRRHPYAVQVKNEELLCETN